MRTTTASRISRCVVGLLALTGAAAIAISPAADARSHGKAAVPSDMVSLSATPKSLLPGIEANNQLLYTDDATRDAAFAKMQKAGVKVVRIALLWRDVATGDSCATTAATTPEALTLDTDPCYQWSQVDSIVSHAKSHGIAVLASVSTVPSWLNGRTGVTPADRFYTAPDAAGYANFVAQYSRFVQAAATRYNTVSSTFGPIKYWTIWNEMNSKTFWVPWTTNATQRYAQLYAAAAPKIFANGGRPQVAPGPTGPNSTGMKPVTYIKSVQPWLAKYNAGPFISAWAHNPYPGTPKSPRTRVYKSPSVGIGNFGELLTALDANKVTKGKPVWATEFSYQTNPPDRAHGTSLQNQATWLAESFDVLARSRRVAIGVWYVFQDPAADLPGQDEWQSGLTTATGAAKPSLAMYSRQVSVSSASVKKGDIVYVYGMSNVSPGSAKLVWSFNGKSGWKTVAGQHKAGGGVVYAAPQVASSVFVALRDAGGIGPARKVTAR